MLAEADLRSSCERRDVSLVVFRSLSGWDEGSIERRRCTCGCVCVCVSPKQERKERERKREKKGASCCKETQTISKRRLLGCRI